MPHAKPLPPRELLVRCLNYDPNTGLFKWRERTPDTFEPTETRSVVWVCKNWNALYAGTPAFTTKQKNGYVSGVVNRRRVYAHRIAWMMMNGEDPIDVDHINGDRSDNRWCNLRSVCTVGNGRNMRLQRRNQSGCPGVQWDEARQRWAVRITVYRAVINLGRFSNLEDAIRVRKNAERRYGFSPTHGRRA